MKQIEILVEPAQAGARLDSLLAAQLTDISRSMIQRLIEEEHVSCNGRTVSKSFRPKEGDKLQLTLPDPAPVQVLPQNIPLNILYEDDHLLVVNKPKGMVVHPAPGNPDGTLVNALLYHCRGSLSGIGGELRPGIVHRIDKDTSGLLVVAKDDRTHAGLSEQMAVHGIHRLYQAVVYGSLKEDGFVEAPIGRHKTDRKKMAVTQQNSKYAYTGYRVLEKYIGFTHIECKLKTGRTHQIRVHMASIGHPLAGDEVYGPRAVIKKLGGQCLHAKTLGFVHPISGKYMEFDSPLPDYFLKFLSSLKKEEP
ncbi:MAG: RluA family pseudouridine synthase [Bacteroidales bacterium]|nr:RluA family pseudouridine synthase [Fournierella massiliensis]MCF2556235.1 RluA family pseudouridine synthase [Fournierella massiliensis]MCI6739517.1 RluA family pseudouridine synthase [Bacteroidales bacterium]